MWQESEIGVVAVFYDLDNEVVLDGPRAVGTNYQANPRVVASNSNSFFLIASDGEAVGDDLYAAYYPLSRDSYTWTTNGTSFSVTGNGLVQVAGHPTASRCVVLSGNTSNLYLVNSSGSASATNSSTLTTSANVGDIVVDEDNDRVIEASWNSTSGGGIRTYDLDTLVQDISNTNFISSSAHRNYVSTPYWCNLKITGRTAGVNSLAFLMGTRVMSDTAASDFAGGVLWTEFSVDTVNDTVITGDVNQFPGVSIGVGLGYSTTDAQLVFGIQNLLSETNADASLTAGGSSTTMVPSKQDLPTMCLAGFSTRSVWPRNTTYTGVSDQGNINNEDQLTKTGNDYTGSGSGSGTEDLAVIARVSNKLARDSYAGSGYPSEITPLISGWYWCVYAEDLIRDSTNVDASPGVPASRVQLTRFRLSTASENKMVDVHDALHINTGYLAQFDGVNAAEVAWHWAPQVANFGYEEGTGGAGGGEPTSANARVCLAWVDGNGKVHRSLPSGKTFHYTAPDLTEGWIDVVVPPSAISGDNSTQWAIEVYAGDEGSETLVRTYFDKVPSPNEGCWRVTYDSTTDSTVSTFPLYIQSELPNDGTLSIFSSTATKDFFFYIPHTQDRVYYCKQTRENKPLEFNEELQIRVPPEGGKLTGLAAMDNTLLIFKRNRIFSVNIPDTNTAFSAAASFRVPGIIPAGTGCLYPASVHVTVVGTFFQSDKGIYLINRGRQVQFIGAGIQDELQNREVVSVSEIPGAREVVFLLDTPDTGVRTLREALVFNYEHEVWTKWEDFAGVAVHADENKLIGGDGQNIYEFSESATGYVGINDIVDLEFAVSTGWVSTVGILGFQRIKRIEIDGEYVDGQVTVEIFYDGESIAHDTFTYYDGDVVFPLRVKPTRQKCKSFRVRVSDTSSTTNTAGFSVRGVQMTVGLKKGMYRRVGERQNR